MNRKALPTLLVVPLLLTAGGCGRLVKEAYETTAGPQGIWNVRVPISQDPNARPLTAYQRFQVGEITEDFGNLAPPTLRAGLAEELDKELAKKKIPNLPEGKTLVIRARVLYYEDARLLGQAFGPLEEAVARIELVDKDTGKVIGLADCVGRTTTTLNQGPAKKAEGLAKAIAGWIDKNYKPERSD